MVLKEEIKAETVRGFEKVQPVNHVMSIRNATDKKPFTRGSDLEEQKQFARLLEKEEKKETKDIKNHDSNHSNNPEEEKVSSHYSGMISAYNRRAQEMHFYITMATTDFKG